MGNIKYISKSLRESSDAVNWHATDGDINFNALKNVNIQSKDKVQYGSYEAKEADNNQITCKLPILIAESTNHKPGKIVSNGKEYVADDMKYGDLTKEEIRKIHRMFNVNIDETATTLFVDLRLMATTVFLTGKLENVGLQMIDKFERNEGGVFKSDTLNQIVGQHASTNRFVAQIKAQIQSALKKHNGDPCVIIRNTDISLVGNPRFNSYGDTFFGGLTFLINDVWAYSVELTAYTKKKIGGTVFYQGKFMLHLFDHFGLDTPDVQKAYVYGAGFRSWFILQHLNTMAYKPFITQIDLEHSFSGSTKIAPK